MRYDPLHSRAGGSRPRLISYAILAVAFLGAGLLLLGRPLGPVELVGACTITLLVFCLLAAALLAGALGRDPEEMRLASPMHDIGKVAVPDSILQKPGKLTWDERQEMERHPDVGHVILSGSGSPLLETAARIAWTHHEKVDGSGYPRGLAGDEIPLDGQIAAVADVFDALTSDRPYRSAFSMTKATEIMSEGRETHFQGHLLDRFFGLGDKLIAVGLREAGSEPVPTLELGLPRRREGEQREVA